jgi:hypothetical protein
MVRIYHNPRCSTSRNALNGVRGIKHLRIGLFGNADPHVGG